VIRDASLTRPALIVGGGVALIVLALALVLRNGDDDRVTFASLRPALVVDERAGVLRGVRFGDTSAEVRRRLGRPSDDEDGFFPAGTDFTGPPNVPLPPSDRGTRVPPEMLHFRDTAYLVSPTAGVFAMATLAEGALTRAGAGAGDDLERVREAYEGVECGEAIGGESPFGEPPTYPWCRTRVGRTRVFFGGDPVESITLAVTAAG
jgi:hypothetical protein